MKNKFKYLEHINTIKRFRGIKNTRLNKIRLDANERVSDFNSKFVNSVKGKINSNHLSAYPEIEQIYDLLKKNYLRFTLGPKKYMKILIAGIKKF